MEAHERFKSDEKKLKVDNDSGRRNSWKYNFTKMLTKTQCNRKKKLWKSFRYQVMT